jgi:hypothetical protein
MMPMDDTSTPNNRNNDEVNDPLLSFFMWAPNDFFDDFGVSPSDDSVTKLKRMARELAL